MRSVFCWEKAEYLAKKNLRKRKRPLSVVLFAIANY